MEPFKNIYNKFFFNQFSDVLITILPEFNKKEFISKIVDSEWEKRELKSRMKHITIVLNDYFSNDFKESVQQINQLINVLKTTALKNKSLEFMFFPNYIEVYGQQHFDLSVNALKEMTEFTSSEFAVRPFIDKDLLKMSKVMLNWADSPNQHIRRLASEGCRPRLPWAMALPELKNSPLLILPIIKKLKEDDSEYVRRSVANNLNDIAKDNPQIVIELVNTWIGNNKNTDKLLKHASRTLLKQGNQELMRVFGFGSPRDIKIEKFRVHSPIVKIGDSLLFSFNLINQSNENELIRLEYAIYYQKANGTLTKKVYKISEKEYLPDSFIKIERKQSFRIITTRKFHIGLHQVALIINGIEQSKENFILEK